MAAITAKENYLRLGRGEIPEWVPGMMPYKDHGPSTAMAGPLTMWVGQSDLKPMWMQPREPWKDFWGANYIIGPEDTGFAGIPDPNNPILRDITKWRTVIKKPEAPNLDWAAMAQSELSNINRDEVALSCALGMQPFEQLVALTGFNDALCYLYEEPDEVKELLNFMADWYVPIVRNIVQHYKPDLVAIADDSAAKQAPFFSPAMYREFFKPIYEKISKPAVDTGAFIDFHNCGRCEDFVGDMIDFGVRYWNPAQIENDLDALKKKFGNKIAICGGWDAPNLTTSSTEEEARQAVRSHIDRYGKGGGYVFFGGLFGNSCAMNAEIPPDIQRINQWISDECYEYGSVFYQNPANRVSTIEEQG
ncbi:MAG: hypothetical protein LBC69_02775 [Eubacteriaceae bacterium]|jgi:hypothetical protein|nr:hypothetical protein [Eubacteriaceae bacterium]